MDIVVCAEKLKGSIVPPMFKSEVIRVLILNGLCGIRPSAVIDKSKRLSDDIAAAENAVEQAFFGSAAGRCRIYVGASAALLRMLAPLLLFLHGEVCFSCEPQLMRRDMSELQNALGCSIKHDYSENTIFFSGGRLDEERFVVCAKNSSQFASGMLIAASVAGFGVRVASPVSAPYIELTLGCLHAFGCDAALDAEGFYSISGRLLPPSNYAFAPDMSYAANFICMDMLGGGHGNIIIRGSERGKNQSDSHAARLFDMDELDVSSSPDLFPILCVHALKKTHDTVIHGTARLKDKESDRLASVSAMIAALGGSMSVFENSVAVHGCGGRLHGGIVDSFGDHRIVMAATAAALMCEGEVIIRGAESVSKSAPEFFDDFRRLGGCAYELIWK